MKSKKIVVIPGDGIGTEICKPAFPIIKLMAKKNGFSVSLEEILAGGTSYDATGTPLTDESLQICWDADAILLGAVGGPKWEKLSYQFRPERALLKLREKLGIYANLRPAVIYGDLAKASTLKTDIVTGSDIMVVRELTGGIYFGHPKGIKRENGKRIGFNTMIYHEDEIRRIVKKAFDIALVRKKRLCSIDKANVLEVTELWRNIVEEESKNYPEVSINHMYIDNAVMQLIKNPQQFDVIVTTNMFGDIVSDAAAMVTGSIGMLPSAGIGGQTDMYEPVHGSAPDIAGTDQANPLATILSVGMMFKYTFGLSQASDQIEKAVIETIKTYRTPDIQTEGKQKVGCREMGELVLEQLQ